jgi:pimeloyl-ACP methyl ester carboxylesterase
MPARTTIVLVHGAFADASGWAGVDAELRGDDLEVLAPANPLRGVAVDGAYISSVIDQLEGPVVLVGHSYGGAVITVAGQHEKVVALVYVSGYVPDEGATLGELQGRFPDSPLAAHLRFVPFPVAGGEPGTDVSVDPAAFPEVFAADVPIETTSFLARSQRPLSASVFEERVPAAAWRTKPSWGIVAAADTTINPDVERFGYQRAGSTVTEVAGASHAVFISQPAAVAAVIREAVAATAAAPTAT